MNQKNRRKARHPKSNASCPAIYLAHVEDIYQALDTAYAFSDLSNKDDPLDELIFIILSTRTPEHRYEAAYARVQSLVQHSWKNLLTVSLADLTAAIGDAGLSTAKSHHIKSIAESLMHLSGEVSLSFLSDLATKDAEQILMSLPGVGTKVAKCVVMCSLDRPVFPVDSHCLRVGSRIGWYPETISSRKGAQAIEDAVPENIRKRLHIRLIQHGRSVCKPKKPVCEWCCITDYCQYFADNADNDNRKN